jgi:ribonuclease VapC
MIVDSSALLAIIFREKGWDALVERIESSPAAAGTPTLAETGIVLQTRLGKRADRLLLFTGDDFTRTDLDAG